MRARAVAPALAAAGALVLSGCTPTVPDSVRTPAAGAPAPEQSPAATGGTETAGFLTSVGAATAEAGSYHMDMAAEADGFGMTASTDVAIADDPADIAVAMTMTMELGVLGSEEIELRLIGSDVYYRTGSSDGMFFRGDPTDPADPTYGLPEAVQAEADPLDSMLAMQDAIVSVTEAGTSTIDGVRAREFEVVVDLSLLPEADLGSLDGAGLPDDATTITYVYALDDDDLPVRISTSVDMGGEAMEMTMSFSRWGEEIVVEAPDPSLVTEDPGVLV